MQLKVSDAYASGDCPCCKHQQYEYLTGTTSSSADTLCGRDAVQLRHRQLTGSVDLGGLAARLRKQGPVTRNEFMLRAKITDNNQPFELTLFHDGRAIIKGTSDAGMARSIYAKYVGT